jgi:hypothetical protein
MKVNAAATLVAVLITLFLLECAYRVPGPHRAVKKDLKTCGCYPASPVYQYGVKPGDRMQCVEYPNGTDHDALIWNARGDDYCYESDKSKS